MEEKKFQLLLLTPNKPSFIQRFVLPAWFA